MFGLMLCRLVSILKNECVSFGWFLSGIYFLVLVDV